MSDLIKKDIKKIAKIIESQETGIEIPKPFEREIFLFDTYVAGTSHLDDVERIDKTISYGDKLVFYREPKNNFDSKAIRIENKYGDKVGYVPRKDNLIFSRLMDSGKVLYGKVEEKTWKENWLKIEIKIYLHES